MISEMKKLGKANLEQVLGLPWFFLDLSSIKFGQVILIWG